MKKTFSVRGGSGNIIEPKDDVRIQDNIYLAVNSDWLKKAKIPADRARIASFDEISIRVEKDLMNDFEDFANQKKALPKVPNFAKAVELYKIAKDFTKRNEDGAKPIQEDLQTLLNLKDFADFNQQAANLATFVEMPFSYSVEPDLKNAQVMALNFYAPGLFLPDTETYKTADAAPLINTLKEQTINLLKMAGVDEQAAKEYTTLAIKFDAKLAKVVNSAEESADYPSLYNPMSFSDFAAKFKDFAINDFTKQNVGEIVDRLIVNEPRFLNHFNELVNPENFEEVKAWLIVNFINDVAEVLSEDFREASFPFEKALTGQKELVSEQKQAYQVANSDFSEVVGVYYGQTYFGSEAKKDVTDMINQMLSVYEKRLANNSWLSEETKKHAIIKLNTLVLKIGYPDKIEPVYDQLEVTPISEGGSLYSNERAMDIVNHKYNMAQLHRPVDRSLWAMPGNLVNACYEPSCNDLTFPAAILQAPFYDLHQDRATNYGGIGAVIAHEVSHAFDNNGSQFDELGNMRNWWTEEDYAEFKKRTKAEIDLFDGLEYGPVKLNGKQIVSENIADQGGLTAAVQAAKDEGLDLKKLFINFARIWANKQLSPSIKALTAIDVHAPSPERANVQIQCQPEFYRVFAVKETDGMWLDPDKRVRIW